MGCTSSHPSSLTDPYSPEGYKVTAANVKTGLPNKSRRGGLSGTGFGGGAGIVGGSSSGDGLGSGCGGGCGGRLSLAEGSLQWSASESSLIGSEANTKGERLWLSQRT